ncbi:hypothetical protein UAY_03247 [Enterococcus moraviensis ATCC BAA-383]|uniref:Uncharacterized protein n=1 Tax=Enterococcus moraviensis ATCC BAA-383 TaxID=1158609 RepID=R2SSP3_9ENTE|nr:hypothetical protein [Enterococcus moraviensis]EOH95821.1 hypothetical protein UAY_03247 [Enterococcus moraviensis ATCC BAA-383]EOT66308.1 hypothetical protein I586_02579 [Enterococcus moraviensis ATCC BAA-383]OJG67629.1 hypothetical protein RV09_GL002398 [Enterococcus moraviensis]
MKKKWILATLLGMVLLFIICIGGKKYMDKKAVEKSYQDGIELIQNYVTDYLVKNYEGIEKIEWQGVGVEWRSSPVFGGSILGNYVVSDVKVFVSSDKFFTMDFTLTEEMEYDQNLKKYVLTDYMNPSNLESTVEMEIGNSTRELSEKDKLRFKKIKKSDKGSPNAQIILNLDIHELTY